MFSTTLGKFILTFLISMVPVVELRGGLPYGIVSGLPYGLAVTAAILGNMLPVPFIILFIEKIFAWLRNHFPKIDAFISALERRAATKQETVDKYGALGLVILVAIPLPGTGAWTGALAAALMKLDMKYAVISIAAGVLIAALIVMGITYGVISI